MPYTGFRLWLANLISGDEIARLNKQIACLQIGDDMLFTYQSALLSIANNTCCKGCQKAARVAHFALTGPLHCRDETRVKSETCNRRLRRR